MFKCLLTMFWISTIKFVLVFDGTPNGADQNEPKRGLSKIECNTQQKSVLSHVIYELASALVVHI